MRLKNITGSREVVAGSPYVVQEAVQQSCPGTWKQIFGNEQPIFIEIGMGKGKFIHTMAKEHPGINYVGIEKYSSVLLRAIQKMEKEEKPLSNVRFIRMDAEMIGDVFGEGEVDRIYLNFSDPWPKARHAQRRLTSLPFFDRYGNIIQPGGRVEFKTDNQALFQFSLEQVEEAAGWTLDGYTCDLHHDAAMNEGNVMTEYEEKFSARGNPIYKLIAVRNR